MAAAEVEEEPPKRDEGHKSVCLTSFPARRRVIKPTTRSLEMGRRVAVKHGINSCVCVHLIDSTSFSSKGTE